MQGLWEFRELSVLFHLVMGGRKRATKVKEQMRNVSSKLIQNHSLFFEHSSHLLILLTWTDSDPN